MAWLAFLGVAPPAVPPGRPSRLPGVLTGVLFGTAAYVVALRFVPEVVARFSTLGVVVGCLALLLLALEQSLRWGVAAVLHRLLLRGGVPSPWAFATGVFMGTFVPSVFPWTPAGGITPVPALVQLAEVVGERGVTFTMALSAGLLAHGFARREDPKAMVRAIAGGLAIPLAAFVLGKARINAVERWREDAPTAAVALVQPSTSAHDRWDPGHSSLILMNLTSATSAAERRGAELTVWPEAAYPFPLAHATRRCPVGSGAMLPFHVKGPVLLGLVMSGGNGDMWNSAAICETNGTLTTPQDKVHLLWFGESIPWLDRIPAVRAKFTRGIGLVPGEQIVPQEAGRVRAAVLNCFEDTLPGAGRDAMSVSPNLLVNITNDAWFEGSAESELHLRLAALRAVESRRDLVRAVNLGATSWVDAAGIVRMRTVGADPKVLDTHPALLDQPRTLFDRAGDVPLALLLGATSFFWGRRRREALTESGPSAS
jgi:apolipoprotein N-acyltransferase